MKRYLLIFLTSITLFATDYYDEFADFTVANPENTRNIRGDFIIAGNTVECVTTSQSSFNGICTNDHNYNDNNYMVKYIDIDEEDGTWNSSSSNLTLPQDFTEILWAGLFWQGNVNNIPWNTGRPLYRATQRRPVQTSPSSYTWDYITLREEIDPEDTPANHLLFKINGYTDYIDVEADELYYSRWGYSNYGFIYSSFKDVTEILQRYESSFIPGQQLTITVANLYTNEGRESWLGNYGAWTLVVVYRGNNNSVLKRVLVYKGFQELDDSDDNDGNYVTKNITIDNLYLPQTGPIHSTFAVFAGEGEETYFPDQMMLENQTMPGARDPNNIFDARLANIERPAIGNNAVDNTNGIDIDIYDVSSIVTEIRDRDPETHELTLTLTTDWDTYYPAMIAFSVQLYEPKICYLETLYDLDGEEITEENNRLSVGSVFQTVLTIRNEDYEVAREVEVVKSFDDNLTEYVPNTLQIRNVNEHEFRHMTDAGNDDLAEHEREENRIRFRLGRGATNTRGGDLEPNDEVQLEFNSTILQSHDFFNSYVTSYQFTIAGQTFYVNDTLKKCTDFNNTIIAYRPPMGTYNVTNPNFSGTIDPTDTSSSLNALYTAIINRPYPIKALSLNNDLQTLQAGIGVIYLDLVDASQLDGNSSIDIASLPVILQEPLHQPIVFGLNSAQNIKIVDTNITLSKITRNATLRIRYINWSDRVDEAKIPCATINEQDGALLGVPRCVYEYGDSELNQVFPNTPCLTSTTGAPCSIANRGHGIPPYDDNYGCIHCLIDYHADYILARDNFAVRPYAFRVFGNNLYKRSGEEFNITIKAVDEANATLTSGTENSVIGLPDFNVSLSTLDFNATFFRPSTTQINTMSAHLGVTNDIANVAYCPHQGTFTLHSGNFQDGKVIATVSYDETGVIELNVSEKPGQEFAIVDSGDTPDEDRYIQPATVIYDKNDISKRDLFVFIPYQFTTTTSISSSTNQNWLYMADVNSTNHNMSLSVEYTIQAQNKNGGIVQNFTKTCFPDVDVNAPQQNGLKLNTTFDLFLDLGMQPSTDVNITFFTESNDSQGIETLTPSQIVHGNQATNIQQWIDPLHFENGIGKAIVHLNIARDKTKPKNPIQITLIDANTSTSWMSRPDATKIFNGNSINRTYSFYYGRLHIPNQTIEGNIGDIKAFYEIFINDNGQDYANIKGSSSPDDIHWYINRSHSAAVGQITNNINSTVADQIKLTNLHPINSGMQKLSLHYLGNIFPYAKNINISTSLWLLYNRYDPTATTISSRTVFTRSGEWLGRGKTFNDSEIDSSKKESPRVLW